MVEQREHGLIQADEKIQSQEQQLIEQNMKIEELQKALKVSPHWTAEQIRWVFDDKGLFSSVLHKNISCEYSLESPRRGDSNEYPQHVFMEKYGKLSLNYPSIIIKYPPYLFF